MVLIGLVFSGLLCSYFKGCHSTLLQEGRGKGNGLWGRGRVGGRELHDISKMAAKQISLYMD